MLLLLLVGAIVAAIVDAARSDSDPDGPVLPAADPAALLAPARSGDLPEFSGTAVVQVSSDATLLGGVVGAPAWSVSLAGLTSGSHTVRVWHGGLGQDRVAFVRPTSETDSFLSGGQRWLWSSAQRTAIRGAPPASPASMWTTTATPAGLTRRLLGATAATTEVSVAGAESVAGRAAYAVVLRPTIANTLVDYVHLAIDGQTKMPLAVQVYAKGISDPEIDVSFTTVHLGPQPGRLFTFRPPSGARVRPTSAPAMDASTAGLGWTTVLCFRVGATRDAAGAGAFSEVRGPWGRGRVIVSPVLSVLLVDDGRVYAGAVPPQTLYDVAAADTTLARGMHPRR